MSKLPLKDFVSNIVELRRRLSLATRRFRHRSPQDPRQDVPQSVVNRQQDDFPDVVITDALTSNDRAHIAPKTDLPFFPQDFVCHYLTTEAATNSALLSVVDGEIIGFDTESVKREHTPEETIIDDMINQIGGSRKSAIQGWHMIELKTRTPFPYAWKTMGLCIVQIARGSDVWVIHLRLIKAFPVQLRRILESPHITKVGVGLLSDIVTIWNDLRIDIQCLIDVGMMARLLLASKYHEGAFQNLSMGTASEEILKYRIDKQEQISDWSTELQPSQQAYAGTDAIAALRLYEVLVSRLEVEATRLTKSIPNNWYSFDSRMGEPTRRQRTIRNEIVPWSVKDCPWFFGGKFQGYYS